MSLATAIALLRAAYPRQDFPDTSVALYGQRLSDLEPRAVEAAIETLIDTSTYLPSISAIRAEVASQQLNLPSPEEAWEIAERGSLRDAPDAVREAANYVGGRYAILNSDNPTTVRAQFRAAYTSATERAVRKIAAPRAANGRPELLAPPEQLGPTMAGLPESTHFRPRPVMTRLVMRWAGRELGIPTEEEQQDAIEVLRAGPTSDDPKDDPLYAEAERVFAEAAS